jgi:hypothetical protein
VRLTEQRNCQAEEDHVGSNDNALTIWIGQRGSDVVVDID